MRRVKQRRTINADIFISLFPVQIISSHGRTKRSRFRLAAHSVNNIDQSRPSRRDRISEFTSLVRARATRSRQSTRRAILVANELPGCVPFCERRCAANPPTHPAIETNALRIGRVVAL